METTNSIDGQKAEILDFINSNKFNVVDIYCINKVKLAFATLDPMLSKLLLENPLGSLGLHFICIVDPAVFEQSGSIYTAIREIWKIFVGLDSYMNASDGERSAILKYIRLGLDSYMNASDEGKSEILKDIHSQCEWEKMKLYQPLSRFLQKTKHLKKTEHDRKLIKLIYLSQDQGLIDLFKECLPIPPLNVFDIEHQPPFLVEMEKKKQASVIEFMSFDNDLERKVINWQRQLRSNLRQKSEIARISKLYFNDSAISKELAAQAIKDANTPYRPKCRPEQADRILQAAKQVKLFDSVTNLVAAKFLPDIFDTCLFGRKNLEESYQELVILRALKFCIFRCVKALAVRS